MQRARSLLAALTIALLVTACGDTNTSQPTTPTTEPSTPASESDGAGMTGDTSPSSTVAVPDSYNDTENDGQQPTGGETSGVN